MASGGVLVSEAGEPIANDSAAPTVRLFLTPVPDCCIQDTWDTTGLRGTGSHDYTIDEVFVPDRFVISHPLMASPVRPGIHYAYPAVAVPMMTAVSLGAARAAVDRLKSLLGAKLDRRSAQPVSDDPDRLFWRWPRPSSDRPGLIFTRDFRTCGTLWAAVSNPPPPRGAGSGSPAPMQ